MSHSHIERRQDLKLCKGRQVFMFLAMLAATGCNAGQSPIDIGRDPFPSPPIPCLYLGYLPSIKLGSTWTYLYSAGDTKWSLSYEVSRLFPPDGFVVTTWIGAKNSPGRAENGCSISQSSQRLLVEEIREDVSVPFGLFRAATKLKARNGDRERIWIDPAVGVLRQEIGKIDDSVVAVLERYSEGRN